MENKQKVMEISKKSGEVVGKILVWFISALLIMWGWNTLAPYLGCPLFTYWEVFAMRMGLIQIVKILWQKNKIKG